VLRVAYDRPSEMIVRGMLGHRRHTTWVRPGLSGYQSSCCFYCGMPVTPLLGLVSTPLMSITISRIP
jgi:hypothetical protein